MPYIAPVLEVGSTALLFKQETTIGTDASPGTSASWVGGRYSGPAILSRSFEPKTQDVTMIPVDPVRVSFTKNFDIVGRALVDIAFDFFIQGSGGSGGQMPWWIPLLESCGHALASGGSGGSSSWALTPIVTPPALTFYHHSGDVRQKITGAFGTRWVATFAANNGVKVNATFRGIWNEPETGVSLPTITLPTLYARQAELEGFGITPSGGSLYTPICPELTIDLAPEASEREDINSAKGLYGMMHSDRNPSLRSIIEREVTLANFNPYSIQQNSTPCALGLTHGSNALGSKLAISVPTAQLGTAQEIGRNKKKCWDLPWMARHNTTDNGEYSWVATEKV